MKAIIIILIINISITQKASSTCEAYITDEWPNSRYTVADISGDNVVTDNKTGLMWKQCTQGITGSTCSAGSLTSHTWIGALDSASTENVTGFAGFTDWRVPNIEELRSIVAINCFNPAINETVFPNTPSEWFWSLSPAAGAPDFAWNIYFNYGGGYNGYRDDVILVRLVHSGQ